jgi:MFS family permease
MAALNLMWKDPLAKYLSPICILFGLSTSFASSILNGEIIQRVLSDPNSTYVGLYTAITSLVAAIASLVFGYLQSSKGQLHCGKTGALTVGASSYLIISLLFLFLLTWDRGALILVYTLLGIGRATYEGTLRAVFADYFTAEKEGAFGIIILFTGTASTIGYILSVTGSLTCDVVSRYCLQYSDGTIHNVLVMELVTIVIAIVTIPSLWIATWMFRSRIIDDRIE